MLSKCVSVGEISFLYLFKSGIADLIHYDRCKRNIQLVLIFISLTVKVVEHFLSVFSYLFLPFRILYLFIPFLNWLNQVFDCGMATPISHLMPCIFTVSGLYKFSLPSLGISSLTPESLSPPRSLVYSRRPPISYLPRLPVFFLSAGPPGFSPVLPPPILDHLSPFSFLSPFPHRFLPLSPSHV